MADQARCQNDSYRRLRDRELIGTHRPAPAVRSADIGPYRLCLQLAALAVLAMTTIPGTATAALHPIPLQSASGRTIITEPAPVIQVQYTLRSYGYTITVDGIYGPQTRRAVRHWQHANRLTVTGQLDPATLSSLRLSSTTTTAPAVRDNLPQGPSTSSDQTPEAIIRDVWPDDLEDHAVAIAYRESRLVPTARNACCLGLFQIHWAAHRAWLAGLGITAPGELLDPFTNATAALALYQMDGWGPWAL